MRSRGWLTIACGLVAGGLVWSTLLLLARTGDDDGAGLANVWALPVGVVGALVGVAALVVAWQSRPRVDDRAVAGAAAGGVLRRVARGEAVTLARLLGDTGAATPANLGFAQPDPAEVRWRTDGGADTGDLRDIAAFHRSLRLGRLVVLGEPGAGKTVLALRLLLDLAADAERALGRDPTAKVLVPVRLSMSSLVLPDSATSPTAIRDRIDAWISRHLTATHGVPAKVARALVADGWVLPVLDGLDETDPDDRDLDQARRILDGLNQPVGPTLRPLVLTCRREHYRRLTDQHSATGSSSVQDATVVVVQPLDAQQVIAWLAHRFPDPRQAHGVQKRWRKVATTIVHHPGGRLATCLSSPLRLYLATAVYSDPGTSPATLCALTSEALDRHLLDSFLPALTRHHPGPDGTRYDPDDVGRWLGTLADHLSGMARLGHSAVDIHLRDLWVTTGTPPGHGIRATATALAVLPLAAFLVWNGDGWSGVDSHFYRGRSHWLLYLLVGVLWIQVVVANLGPHVPATHHGLDLDRVRTRDGRRLVAGGVARTAAAGFPFGFGTVAVLVLMIGEWHAADVPLVLLVCAGFGVVGGVGFGVLHLAAATVSGTPHVAARPSEPLRRQVAHSIVVRVVVALICATIVGTLVGIGENPGWGFRVGALTLTVALLAGGALTTLVDRSMRPVLLRYLLAAHHHSRSGRLPRRPARFLDWAHAAGLLRLAGTATQFRHRDLQDHFGGARPASPSIASPPRVLR